MFKLEDVLQLKADERVLMLKRRHITSLLPSLLLSLVLIVIPFFLLFTLFAWGLLGVVLFFAAVLLGLILAIRTLLLWDSNVFLLTNIRLIYVDQRGVFTRLVSEMAMASIQDVAWAKSGLIEALFRVGSVTVRTSSNATALTIKRISQPQAVHELINDLRHHGGAKQIGTSASFQPEAKLRAHSAVETTEERGELLDSIAMRLEKYSLEELHRIEAVLKARERSAVAEAFFDDKRA